MSSAINWEAAQARHADAKRQDAAPTAHPFALFVALTSRRKKRHS
jgi:hypothetical protein